MLENTVKVSANFKKMTQKSIFAILLFILVYVVLLLFAVGLTIVCVAAAFMLVAFKPMFLTFGLGIGLVSLGVLILIFLFKFIFKTHKNNVSHLIEITKKDEPKLFQFIEEIVKEVGTDFPKKIYLSSDVNACVFYNSNFWSMFFPVRKNLQIGMALVNSVTEHEFKAILAHEFGHFSQKSMKVGSYVYNVNQVIFNMLDDNKSYENLIEKWANLSGYFAIFVSLAIKIIQAIQFVLQKMHKFINISYMSLSREMEFHADEISAHVAGSLSLKNSLLRLEIAQHSFKSVINFYEGKITDCVKSQNIFAEQHLLMNFFAKQSKLEFENDLPKITVEELNKYNKSKLNIKDQWASHPSTADRILALDKLNIVKENPKNSPANLLFQNIEQTQSKITESIFANVNYAQTATLNNAEEFAIEFEKKYFENSFGKKYNGYYDPKEPIFFEIDTVTAENSELVLTNLFDNEKQDLVLSANALASDINVLKQIAQKNSDIKTFDYDGKKYSSKDCNELISKLNLEVENTKNLIAKNDINIFVCFREIAKKQDKEVEFVEKYRNFFDFDKVFNKRFDIYSEFSKISDFINSTNSPEMIEYYFKKVAHLEVNLRAEIKNILADDLYQADIDAETREMLEKYISREWTYFVKPEFEQNNFNLLFAVVDCYHYLISKNYFAVKKDLLAFQHQLFEN